MAEPLFERPGAVRLPSRLGDVEHALGWTRRAGSHLALELGVDDARPLDEHLFRVVDRLGPVRFDAVFAVRGSGSWVRVAPATLGGPAKPPDVRVRTTASATTIDWKQQVHDACAAAVAAPAPPGPVTAELRLTLSRRRNWTALWEPALDALGPILGVPDPDLPYKADDARIRSLGLHRRIDDTIGPHVVVEVWWATGAGRR